MSATTRDEDTGYLKGAPESVEVAHFYLDVTAGQLHSLNEAARNLRADGVPLLAQDAALRDLRNERGKRVAASELPMVLAVGERRPVEAQFLLCRPGQPTRRLHYSVTPLQDSAGHVSVLLASVVCFGPAPDWTLLAGLAHDLRTPLQSLQMLRQILDNESLTEAQQQDALARLDSAAGRSLQLAQELLEWCRTRGGRPAGARREWFALEPLLREVFSEQAPAAAKKGLTLRPAVTGVRGLQILSDRSRLARILANLLVNAVRYTPAGGQIRFGAAWELHEGRRTLILEVQDTGVGISLQDQESIFHPFERGQSGRDLDSTGSGVGLSVVDRLTVELGLDCELTSAAGAGSRFCIRIPQQLLRLAPADTASQPATR